MTPRQRSLSALRGEKPDKVPFLTDVCPPLGTDERRLRNRGMCICSWDGAYDLKTPNMKIESIHYKDGKGRNIVKNIYSTPHGELCERGVKEDFTTWKEDYIFKTFEDYKKIVFMVQDTVVFPCPERSSKLIKDRGEDALCVAFAGWSPLTTIIYHYMGTERFAYEWADNRASVLDLYSALEDLRFKILEAVADSPHDIVIYDANCVPEIISPENFKNYMQPHYEKAINFMHRNGKLIGSHFDGNNTPYMELIADIAFDFINAYDVSFSPPVKEARRIWPDKVLWLNFPCAWHMLEPAEIKQKTMQLIDEAYPSDGFIIGITETVPQDRICKNFKAIMDGIDEYEKENCQLSQ